jgi:hypothetical protein
MALVPITATLVFTPAVLIVLVISPSPIVGMNDETEFRTVMINLPGMPAIAFMVADDCGRRSER